MTATEEWVHLYDGTTCNDPEITATLHPDGTMGHAECYAHEEECLPARLREQVVMLCQLHGVDPDDEDELEDVWRDLEATMNAFRKEEPA